MILQDLILTWSGSISRYKSLLEEEAIVFLVTGYIYLKILNPFCMNRQTYHLSEMYGIC